VCASAVWAPRETTALAVTSGSLSGWLVCKAGGAEAGSRRHDRRRVREEAQDDRVLGVFQLLHRRAAPTREYGNYLQTPERPRVVSLFLSLVSLWYLSGFSLWSLSGFSLVSLSLVSRSGLSIVSGLFIVSLVSLSSLYSRGGQTFWLKGHILFLKLTDGTGH